MHQLTTTCPHCGKDHHVFVQPDVNATAQARQLDRAIRALLADYDAGVFEQHATLHATARRRIEALRAALPKRE